MSYNLESKIEFFDRVERNLAFLNLDSNPFNVTNDMINLTYMLVANFPLNSTIRARAIYNWMCDNFRYDKNMGGYRPADVTFKIRRGRCADFGILYTSLARVAGLTSNLVDVPIDVYGKKVYHACSIIYLEGKKILVDITYNNGFDIKHKCEEMDDNEAKKYYNEHCEPCYEANISSDVIKMPTEITYDLTTKTKYSILIYEDFMKKYKQNKIEDIKFDQISYSDINKEECEQNKIEDIKFDQTSDSTINKNENNKHDVEHIKFDQTSDSTINKNENNQHNYYNGNRERNGLSGTAIGFLIALFGIGCTFGYKYYNKISLIRQAKIEKEGERKLDEWRINMILNLSSKGAEDFLDENRFWRTVEFLRIKYPNDTRLAVGNVKYSKDYNFINGMFNEHVDKLYDE